MTNVLLVLILIVLVINLVLEFHHRRTVRASTIANAAWLDYTLSNEQLIMDYANYTYEGADDRTILDHQLKLKAQREKLDTARACVQYMYKVLK